MKFFIDKLNKGQVTCKYIDKQQQMKERERERERSTWKDSCTHGAGLQDITERCYIST